MRALRSRLIVGITFLAVLPTAVSLFVLSNRIESTVRRESEQRLDAALQSIRSELASRAASLAEKVELLGQDPELRRHLLVGLRWGPEVQGYLAGRRSLLDLDYLTLADEQGTPTRSGPYLSSVPPGASTTPGSLAIAAEVRVPYRSEGAGSVTGGVVVSDSLMASFARVAGFSLAVLDSSGAKVLATSGGMEQAPLSPGSAERRTRFPSLIRRVPLEIGPPPHPLLEAIASTESAGRTVAALRETAALVGVVGVLLAIILGAMWSAQVARPVERLAAFSDRVARGEWDEPLGMKSVKELEALVSALDRMRADLRSYRDRLRVSERQAAWGQMARKVAHEIKNPLTPIAVSVEDLKRSYQQNRADFPEILAQATQTIAEEMESMKRLLQELSDFGRLPAPRMEPCTWERLAGNLEALYRRDVAAGRLSVARPGTDIAFPADPGQLQQVLVNLIQNGFDAAGPAGHVKVAAGVSNSSLEISVADDGPGLTPEQRANLFVPGFTTKEHGSGLGLTIVERIVNDHAGSIEARSERGAGTTIAIRLPLHPRSPKEA